MPVVEDIERIVKLFPQQYYKLLLLIGPSGSGKTFVLKKCMQVLMCKYINLNLELSRKLKEIPVVERCYYVQDYIDEIVKNNDSDIIIFDDIEILFSKHLKIDPLSALKNISKYKKFIAAWPGYIKGGYLVYAEEGHEDYIRYNLNELECSYLNLGRGIQDEI